MTGHSVAEATPGQHVEVCVFGPSLYATVTVEQAADGSGAAVHFHPGGQAFWIARMLNHLGMRSALVSPVGGEAGVVLGALMPTWGVDLIAVPTTAESPAYVHERRDGTRREIVTTSGDSLSRHDIDDLYAKTLEVSARSGTCVVTGSRSGRAVGRDFYHRLGNDLAQLGVTVVGDLHGEELDAFLEAGRLDVLKVSHDDLVEDGRLPRHHELDDRVAAAEDLRDRGVDVVVVSAPAGAVIVAQDDVLYGAPPQLEPVDSRGAGDAMTAALCAAVRRDDDLARMLRFGCAAGAATVARHGLANADRSVIDTLADAVEVCSLRSGRRTDPGESNGTS
jgi:1-phosphofructokinase